MSYFVKPRAAAALGKSTLLMAAAALSCALGAGTATAATADRNAPSLVVHFSSDTLATHTGVEDLYRRIVLAARHVCPAGSIRELKTNELMDQCRKEAVSRAIQKVNNSQLAALHANSTKSG